jgi:hypothetical protein
MKKGIVTVFLIALYTTLHSQETQEASKTLMRSEGKIYVVLAVVLTIFAGLILFLIRLERKIRRMEKS